MYTYNVEDLKGETVSRMRLELGDTQFNPAELTAALQDEEYQVMIDESSSWKAAKIKCIQAILMKFSHQTKTTVGTVSYDFADRVAFWKKLYDEVKSGNAIPVSFAALCGGDEGSKMYFHTDMQKNWGGEV